MSDEVARSLPVTQWALADMEPHEWVRLADFLSAMLRREPFRSGAAYISHRIALGALATELRQNAIAVGEPAGEPDDEPLWIETQQWREYVELARPRR